MKVDDAFDEVKRAMIEDKEVSVSRRSEAGEVRWTIVIRNNGNDKLFQNRLFNFFSPEHETRESRQEGEFFSWR